MGANSQGNRLGVELLIVQRGRRRDQRAVSQIVPVDRVVERVLVSGAKRGSMATRRERSLRLERSEAVARSHRSAECAVDAVRKASRRRGHGQRREFLRHERRNRVAGGGSGLRVAVEIARDDCSIRQQEGQDFGSGLLCGRLSNRDSEHHAHH